MNQLNTKKFKMETPTTIIQLTRPNVCMAKLDIRMLTTASQLTCEYKSRLFKFMVLPNGKFTKLSKPPMSLLSTCSKLFS